MAMCVIVTRDAPARFRGFLASCMLEIAPGVYTQPDMTVAVRERVWKVLRDWWVHYAQGSVVMTWAAPSAAERQQVRTLGEPPKELCEYDGMYLVRRAGGEDVATAKRDAAEPGEPAAPN